MVRTFPEVSELWVEVLGSGVDLLGPSSPPGKKATYKREETEARVRPADMRWPRRERGLVGRGMALGRLRSCSCRSVTPLPPASLPGQNSNRTTHVLYKQNKRVYGKSEAWASLLA